MKRTFKQRCLATTVLGAGLFCLVASPVFAQGTPERNAYFGKTPRASFRLRWPV